MDPDSKNVDLSEKLGTILNISESETKGQDVTSKKLSCGESADSRQVPVENSTLGACGDTEKPQIAHVSCDQETVEEHFYECRESLESDDCGTAECVEGAASLSPEDDIEVMKTKKLEFDEEYLRELEKDLPEEEKKKRQDESLKLKGNGNEQFKGGEYTEAETSYTKALEVCPACYQKDRSILYSNRAAARMKLEKKEDAISDCTEAIQLNPNYIRAILRRAELYQQTEKLDEALEDYKMVVEKDPSVVQAREACMRLPQQIEERNEKMKEEMMGKLKDLGNMILRPFGLSSDNFQLNKDPNSGSYSVNFVQNPNNNDR
uniref:Tetratricopeptide repeat protein 1 n=1 Tax=Callorhinchus milii TaxID=7868 RepID=A0A4W3HG25_CALMI|eukprot:gi/632974557/ref/XP_007903744.1/ PREDICTED: tetratricopeptide repeat protein 1 [Callorhinchus milii]